MVCFGLSGTLAAMLVTLWKRMLGSMAIGEYVGCALWMNQATLWNGAMKASFSRSNDIDGGDLMVIIIYSGSLCQLKQS